MKVYEIFQDYVINYTVVVALFGICNICAGLYYGDEAHGRWAILTFFNQYKKMKMFWVPLMVASIIYPFVWTALFLGAADALFVNSGVFGSLEGDEFITWLGTVPPGFESEWYLVIIFIGILGAKGSIVLFEIANILRKDDIVVTTSGIC
jgi:hypothetical protein